MRVPLPAARITTARFMLRFLEFCGDNKKRAAQSHPFLIQLVPKAGRYRLAIFLICSMVRKRADASARVMAARE